MGPLDSTNDGIVSQTCHSWMVNGSRDGVIRFWGSRLLLFGFSWRHEGFNPFVGPPYDPLFVFLRPPIPIATCPCPKRDPHKIPLSRPERVGVLVHKIPVGRWIVQHNVSSLRNVGNQIKDGRLLGRNSGELESALRYDHHGFRIEWLGPLQPGPIELIRKLGSDPAADKPRVLCFFRWLFFLVVVGIRRGFCCVDLVGIVQHRARGCGRQQFAPNVGIMGFRRFCVGAIAAFNGQFGSCCLGVHGETH
mmetsp:Transcript_28781/g.77965  ORF Transcript_28781/g.77965 Transcript_28781/m.77965 type:complete len:249 (-) Transcript_28781:961-1707(-)